MGLVINSAARPYESSGEKDNERVGATDRGKMGSEKEVNEKGAIKERMQIRGTTKIMY